MTDGQWALLAPLLPAAGSTGGRGGRPEKWYRRLVLDAIFYLVRGGIAWRALPADFPPHQTVYALFRPAKGNPRPQPSGFSDLHLTAAPRQLGRQPSVSRCASLPAWMSAANATRGATAPDSADPEQSLLGR